MLPYEQYRQQHIYQPHFDSEASPEESYSSNMEYNYGTTAFNNSLRFNFAEPTQTYADASMDSYKHDMARTPSNSSVKRTSHEYPPVLSAGSIGSASSSPGGSPYSGHANMVPAQENYHLLSQIYMPQPRIVCDPEETFQQAMNSTHDLNLFDQEHKLTVPYANVDPHSLFNQQQFGSATGYSNTGYSGYNSSAPSPVPSQHSYITFSNAITLDNYNLQARVPRGVSVSSHRSGTSPRTSFSSDDDNVEKGKCTYPDCGRVFKDLKAHMLTHQNERPEKCPLITCEYHFKGFARKYDKNRHTLTHYKGTMICGFCPGSGSPAEKSFNRADVFKRHLTSVHGVEQNPPNSRKRSPSSSNKVLSSYCQDATGKCSTCSVTFNNAQDFYEHLDDCVLRIVQQEDPSERINQQRLAEVAADPAVQETFDRNMIKHEESQQFAYEDAEEYDDNNDDLDDEEEEDEIENSDSRCGKGTIKGSRLSSGRVVIGGNISKKPGKKNNMTWSKIGVPLAGKGRKRRKHYPPSWGMSVERMKMKKRVLCVYDGPRRLLKDDMMLDNEFEVRMKLGEGDNYVTDLDVETLKRAEAYHGATEEEKGAWIPEQDFFTDLM